MVAIRIVVVYCSRHPHVKALTAERGDSGFRIAGPKCCGTWEKERDFKVDAVELIKQVGCLSEDRDGV